jgi:hypothetical protein
MPRARARKPRKWPNKILLAAAGLAMVATWAYGFWKGISTGFIAIPIGIAVAVCTVGAFSFPFITAVLTVCGALTGIDVGAIQAIRNGVLAFLAAGAGSLVIHGIRYLMQRGWLR